MMSDKQMKMADVFELPVKSESIIGFKSGVRFEFYTTGGVTPHEKAAEAINNHDRLTAENEALREEVERVRAANLDSVAVCDQALRAKAAAEQERDQLKVALSLIATGIR